VTVCAGKSAVQNEILSDLQKRSAVVYMRAIATERADVQLLGLQRVV
jgi:3-oxoacyl-ACP reductase-like protein